MTLNCYGQIFSEFRVISRFAMQLEQLNE